MARGTKTITTARIRNIRTGAIVETYSNTEPVGIFQEGTIGAFPRTYYPPEENSLDCQDTDVTPDAFSFTPQTSLEINTLTTSAPSTAIAGLGSGNVVSVVIEAGFEYRKNGGGSWGSAIGIAENGDTFEVRGNSAAAYDGVETITLTIGGVAGIFTMTNRTAANVTVNYAMIWGTDPTTPHWNVVERTRNGITTNIATIQSIASGTLPAGDFKEGDTIKIYQGAYDPFMWAPDSNVNLVLDVDAVEFYNGDVTTQSGTQNTGAYIIAAGVSIIDITSTGSSTAVGYNTENLEVINSATSGVLRVTVVDQSEAGLGLTNLEPIGEITTNYSFNVLGTTGLLTVTIYNDGVGFSIDYELDGEGGYTQSGSIPSVDDVEHNDVTKGGLILTIPSL